MSSQKPSIPKGTRDFSPVEMVRRNYIFDTIRNVFQLFGYQPIETPAMENLSTLMGKYGEEGDKLLFKILNSGDYLQEVQNSKIKDQNFDLKTQNHKELTPYISEKGLRYDLTVPFARFVVQHQHELAFPFKRYQIQPVWRADRPQKGRYREFFQCDVDVIGSNSLLNEIELAQIIDEVFTRLDIPVIIKLNNRKILAGIAESIGAPDKLTDITMAIDKLDKVGLDKVNEELASRGLTPEAISRLQPVLLADGKIKEKKTLLEELFAGSATGTKGIEELCYVLRYLKELNLKNKFDFDLRLARGLNYYTGSIIEVKARDSSMGSLCGGGRYDDLTGIFGLPGVSGVGVSFGADRIYDVLLEMKRFPEALEAATRLMFVNFGPGEEKYCMDIISGVRASGIACEIYPDAAKLKKQMDYANRKNIPFVAFAGKDEIFNNLITVKDMKSGEQKSMRKEELINFLLV